MSHIHFPDGVLPVWLWVSGFIVAILVGTILFRFISHARKPQALKPGDEWHPFVAKRRPFPAYSGMVEGHAGYARGLKPRSLDRGVGSLRKKIWPDGFPYWE